MAQPQRNSPPIGLDFTSGSIPKLLITFIIPILLSQTLGSAYNMIDMIIIGHVTGKTGTVAVTMGGKMLILLTNISYGLATGGQIFISHLLGENGHGMKLREQLGTLISATVITSILFQILSMTLARPILSLLNTPAEAFDEALRYLLIVNLGIPFLFCHNSISCALNGMGDSVRPLILIAIAAAVNLVLDLLLAAGLGMGVSGAAIATVAGQFVSFCAAVLILYRRREETGFRFRPSDFRICLPHLKKIAKMGIPVATAQSLTTISQIIIIGFVNGYGIAAAAAYGVADKIISLLNIVSISMKNAASTIVGQNYGARRFDRVQKTLYYSLIIGLPFAAAVSAFCVLCPTAVFRLFSSDADVLNQAASFLYFAPPAFLLSAVLSSFGALTIGLGRSDLVFAGGVLDSFGCRFLFCFLFGVLLDMGVAGFFLGSGLARIGPITIDMVYYFFGKWRITPPTTNTKGK